MSKEKQWKKTILKPIAVFHAHSVGMQEDKMIKYTRYINYIPLCIVGVFPIFENSAKDKVNGIEGKKKHH